MELVKFFEEGLHLGLETNLKCLDKLHLLLPLLRKVFIFGGLRVVLSHCLINVWEEELLNGEIEFK